MTAQPLEDRSPSQSRSRLLRLARKQAGRKRPRDLLAQYRSDISLLNLGWAGDTVDVRQRPTNFPKEDATLIPLQAAQQAFAKAHNFKIE